MSKKILFLSRLFYPHIGGVEKHIFNLSQELILKGHNVTVISEQHIKKLKKFEEYKGISIFRIPINTNDRFKKFQIWFYVLKNIRLFLNSEIIHCHDVFYWVMPIRIMLGRKVFTTFHGYEGNFMPNNRSKFMHKAAEIFSSGNICIGNFFKKWYGTKSDFISYGAVDISHGYRTKVENHKIIRILYIGRLENEAGIIDYINSLIYFKKKGYDFVLTVLGDGSQRKIAETLSKKYSLNIKFLGFVEDVLSYIDKTDVVFTSRYLGIIEAMSRKKPVFAYYNNEIKKDYLLMTPFSRWITISKDYKDISEGLYKFIDNPKSLHKKIETAYMWSQKQTWNNLAEQYLKLWSKIEAPEGKTKSK